MSKNPFKKRLITSLFITMILTTTLSTLLLSEATATQTTTKIEYIIPESGHVGHIIRVVGEIDTPGGPYQILWDRKNAREGTCEVGSTAVNDTFAVPLCAGGDHNVTLYDVTNRTESLPMSFRVTTSYYVLAEPARIQEGLNTTITLGINEAEANATYTFTINVTDPQPAPACYTTAMTVSTNATGSGSNSTVYYGNFSAGTNTNYVGTYVIVVMADNETLTMGNFTVGLTDKLEYRRTYHTTPVSVDIRGAGYNADEQVTVNITTARIPVLGYPKIETAGTDGVVTHLWRIPVNATLGTYTVTLTNATEPGTVKTPVDAQNFWIVERIFLNVTSGRWETPVGLTGEIATSNGTYQIWWDGESIEAMHACMRAQSDGAVNATFIVPISVKGDHEITLYDNTTKTASLPFIFEVTTSCYVSVTEARIQEGEATTIRVSVDEAKVNETYTFIVNVTDPAGQPHSINRTIIIDDTFSGENSTTYWSDFTDTDANTDYVGTYNITVITANKTLATGNFTVGLTDRAEYVRRYLEKGIETNGEVSIRASGYHENQTATINITYHENETACGKPVKGYPKSVNASAEGVVTDSWIIPDNASLGIYTVALVNATPVEPKVDIQNFTVVEITVYCQPQNRYDSDPSPLPDVSIGVYDEEGYVGSGITNRTGWVDFLLDRGNYTFMAFWKKVPVGSLNGSTTETSTGYFLQIKFYIKCELAHIKMVVSDESVPPRRLPFINVTLISNRTTDSFETSYEGTVSTNTFTNITYRIEARRYSHLFFNQSIGNLTSTPPQINITCPTYTLFIHASDSKEHPIQNATVEVIEWGSGRITGKGKTGEWGSVRLSCTFGRYKVRVYNVEQTVILNETVVDVIRNQFYLVLHCRTVNLDLSVKVVDYLGQPIPNAIIKIEREGMEIPDLVTGPDGIASEHEILGGDYRICLYVAGRLCGVKSLYLDEPRDITFRVGDYVMVGGYPLEFNQLITGISLTILVAFCALALIYRRRSKES